MSLIMAAHNIFSYILRPFLLTRFLTPQPKVNIEYTLLALPRFLQRKYSIVQLCGSSLHSTRDAPRPGAVAGRVLWCCHFRGENMAGIQGALFSKMVIIEASFEIFRQQLRAQSFFLWLISPSAVSKIIRGTFCHFRCTWPLSNYSSHLDMKSQ